ncbi:hypothetical protein E4K72_17515 [Oxalobacteraceae bacterium OM1]|nr:hypothetical protein E4K72_17515 [Oxalobacteraceae bacterium OM1]
MKRNVRRAWVLLGVLCGAAQAQQLDTHFSCSAKLDDKGEPAIFADTAEFKLKGDTIESFRWESSLFRSTHGFDCSIDEDDGLLAEVREDGGKTTWRVGLQDPQEAREKRGYGFDRIPRCTIRLVREGDRLNVMPSCPALCGSRANFTQLSVDMKTGKCDYEQ